MHETFIMQNAGLHKYYRKTPWTVFPALGLSMCLNCQESLPPAYIYELLLWWACRGCLMAMKYHLREGLMSLCCWSLTFMEPEIRRSVFMPGPQKGFAQPEPGRCWLPGPVCTDCCCVSQRGQRGPFSSYLLPKAILPEQLCVCSSAGLNGWWLGDGCILPSLLVSEP